MDRTGGKSARLRRNEVLVHVPPRRLAAPGPDAGLRYKNSPARSGGGVIGSEFLKVISSAGSIIWF
jgi:hypothetical protein